MADISVCQNERVMCRPSRLLFVKLVIRSFSSKHCRSMRLGGGSSIFKTISFLKRTLFLTMAVCSDAESSPSSIAAATVDEFPPLLDGLDTRQAMLLCRLACFGSSSLLMTTLSPLSARFTFGTTIITSVDTTRKRVMNIQRNDCG